MASHERLEAALRLLSRGSWHEAEAAARIAMTEDPSDPCATLLLGLAIAAMGEDVRAAPVLMQVSVMRPDADHPCLDLARLTPLLPRALVTRQFRTCLGLASADNRLRLAFASFLLDTGQLAEAEATLLAGQESAVSQHMLGAVHAETNQFPAAIERYQRAVELGPNAAASWSNLGMMLKIEGRFAEAIAAHDRAVALNPGNHHLRVNRAVALLKAGHWQQAWKDYESRLRLTDPPWNEAYRLLPSLRPGDTLDGTRIVALHEDGFGDTLQFLRYLPLLAQLGARVVACVPKPLVRVMRGIPGVAEVVTDIAQLPAHDFICPMFSLPRVFGTTIHTIPPVPEFASDEALVRRWDARLPSGRLRAGLVWAGQARPSLPGFATLDRRRSAGLAAFASLFDLPGVALVSLQAGPAARQLRPAGSDVVDVMRDVEDFADTAAIIAGLDVVISVDTSVVHLAGLMGKPVFLLDRYDGCWRWLSDRCDSPWYPDLTIFRQQRPGDWSGPMAGVAASLGAMATCRGFSPSSESRLREHAFVA